MLDYIYTLKNPEKEYRPHPFWSWNYKLDPDEVRRQVHIMKKAGLGGYFMHARGGLITEYLSNEWFDAIRAGVDQGKMEDMEAWSYDEEGWPSGFAGGIVTAMGDEYHVRNLLFGEGAEIPANAAVLGLYAVTESGHYRWVGENAVNAEKYMTEGEKLYYVAHEKNQYYVDILSPKVVRAFIDCTYERYANELGSDFGGMSMPGFFTDEPQYARGRVPWSYAIPDAFREAHGYSPEEHLICIFMEVQGAEKFRYDFWQTVSKLYTESFGKQIYDWCCEHNCKWTGHAMMEDNLLSQMGATAGVMPLYEYMHVPGIDWLCRGISSPIVPKQVGSAARQLGKKLVMTESFAGTGWDVSFEELKWILEFQYVNGVNCLCPHLESYTIKGIRKRDWPPSLFYQSPWWNDYKCFNDYVTRLGKLLADGEEKPEVLLLHPMHSAWIAYDSTNNERISALDHSFVQTTLMLMGAHIQYHYGDENIIASHGSVEGANFVVGNCRYRKVVLPKLETIDETTFELLCRFLDNGGKIYAADSLPYRIGGKIDSRIRSLNDRVITIPSDAELRSALFAADGFTNVSVSSKRGEVGAIHMCVRHIGGERAYFFVNLDNEHAYDVKITLRGEKNAVRLALENLKVYECDMITTDAGVEIYMHFEPMQSVVLLAGENLPDSIRFNRNTSTLIPAREWNIEECSENILTLDYISYSADGSDYSEYKPVLGVMDELLARRANSDLLIKYRFTVADGTDLEAMKELTMVMEYDESWEITVNGAPVRHDLVSWWKDREFKAINIKERVQIGLNEIVIKGKFYQRQKVYDVLFGENVLETERNKLTYDTEIESIYLIGDFGVETSARFTEGDRKALYCDGPFRITNRRHTLIGGEIVRQGYPFFSGTMKISQEFEISAKPTNRLYLRFPKPYAVLVKIYVNDKFVKILPWAEYAADITDSLKVGTNKLTVELITGNRNLFGPHHRPEGESYVVTPNSFGPNGNYSPSNWRDRYCFVKTGFGN